MTIQVIFGILSKLEILIVAGIAQSVEQLIRNQQVVCSSHITSSIYPEIQLDFGVFNLTAFWYNTVEYDLLELLPIVCIHSLI